MSEDNNNDKPKVTNTTIRLAGDKENCGVCKDGDEFFRDNASKVGANYEDHHIESERGKDIAGNIEEGPNGTVPIPAIEYCKTIDNKDGEKEEKCDYVEGFSKSDWDSNLNYKKPNDVDEEIDELFGDQD